MLARSCTEQERVESGAPAVAGRVLLKATGPVPYVYVLASELPAGMDAALSVSILVNLQHAEWSADETWPLAHVADKPGTGRVALAASAETATPVPRSKSAPAPAAPRTPQKDAASAAVKPVTTPAVRTPARTPVTTTPQPVYAPHMDVAEALRQVEQGTLCRGQLRVNAKNPRQAFVSVHKHSLDAIWAQGWTCTNPYSFRPLLLPADGRRWQASSVTSTLMGSRRAIAPLTATSSRSRSVCCCCGRPESKCSPNLRACWLRALLLTDLTAAIGDSKDGADRPVGHAAGAQDAPPVGERRPWERIGARRWPQPQPRRRLGLGRCLGR